MSKNIIKNILITRLLKYGYISCSYPDLLDIYTDMSQKIFLDSLLFLKFIFQTKSNNWMEIGGRVLCIAQNQIERWLTISSYNALKCFFTETAILATNYYKYVEIANEDKLEMSITNILSNPSLYREAQHLQKQVDVVSKALDKLQSDRAILSIAVNEWLVLLESEVLDPYKANMKEKDGRSYRTIFLCGKHDGPPISCLCFLFTNAKLFIFYKMLTKFETKSPRVKGLSFHPKRPWVLARQKATIL
ncbi:Coatomer subunit alpha [Armadillidium nasatum]|uniref:Coatomer subunit alpha n=1 Tax=Armadillidium nasatum TaxID=96803 RepID=A0A5N5TP98_9CRUS|nr:Coatomer subunit alpha [Armadillidium nasatum]